MILLPPYAIRVVQSASSLFPALPLQSNIAEYSSLKMHIGMIFTPTPVSNLHPTSMGGPLMLPFVSSGHMLIIVKACGLSLCCMSWTVVTIEP